MKYEFDYLLQSLSENISYLIFPHIKVHRIKCFKSYGTSTRNTIARCHALGKLLQKAMGVDAFYALEFISEQFDKLDNEEKIKVIIHELMHIPESFGGGFKHHDVVCDNNVEDCYNAYLLCKKTGRRIDWFSDKKRK